MTVCLRLGKTYRLCSMYNGVLEDRYHLAWNVVYSQQTALQSNLIQLSAVVRSVRRCLHRACTVNTRLGHKRTNTDSSRMLAKHSMALLLCMHAIHNSSKQLKWHHVS